MPTGSRVRGGVERASGPLALLIPAAPRRQDAPVRQASAHLLRAVETLSLSVPSNSFLLPGRSSPRLSGLSYCQFVFIKITILARHWEIRETMNLVLMKRGVSITQGTGKFKRPCLTDLMPHSKGGIKSYSLLPSKPSEKRDAYVMWCTGQLAAASEGTHLCAQEAHSLRKIGIQHQASHPSEFPLKSSNQARPYLLNEK